MKLGDEDLKSMIAEVGYFKENGGGSIVEATTIGIGPNWDFLKQVSEATGVHIIAGAGHYMGFTLPDYAKKATVEELRDVSMLYSFIFAAPVFRALISKAMLCSPLGRLY